MNQLKYTLDKENRPIGFKVRAMKTPEQHIQEAKLSHQEAEVQLDKARKNLAQAERQVEAFESAELRARKHLDNLYIQQFPSGTRELLLAMAKSGALNLDKKVNAIKGLRNAFGAGLRESKAMIDSLYE
jgi:hypothetical protein